MAALPFLDTVSFTQACTHFYFQTVQTRLDISWRHSPWSEEDLYLAIRKDLQESNASNSTTALALAADDIEDEIEAIPDEYDAQELRIPSELPSNSYKIEYHILLSPLYRLPVLYFNIYSASSTSPFPITLAQIHTLLVPSDLLDPILNVAIQGAISQGDHPYLQTPFWFVHPCQTAEALQQWSGDLSVENYLGIWVGLVGRDVGLELEMPVQESVKQQYM